MRKKILPFQVSSKITEMVSGTSKLKKLAYLSFSSPKICQHKMQIGHQIFFFLTNKKNRFPPPSKKKKVLSVASLHRRLVQRLLDLQPCYARVSLLLRPTDTVYMGRTIWIHSMGPIWKPGQSSGPTQCCCLEQYNVYKCGCQNL